MGVEVSPHLKPGILGAGEVGGGILVGVHPALGVAPVAQPHEGELHPGICHLLPVHLLLMLGHIHPQQGVPGGAGQISVPLDEILGRVGIGGQRGLSGGDGGFGLIRSVQNAACHNGHQ